MRNIVLITLDSLRADHCSFMGYGRKTTPNIDSMAKNGLYFENAIASAIGTPASMTGIFTGEYATTDPVETSPEPWRKEISKRQTLAQILSKQGYSTGAFHPNAFVSSYFGFDKGFDYFQDFLSDEVGNGLFSRLYTRVFEKVSQSGRGGLPSALRNLRNLLWKEEVFKPWESYYDKIVKWVERTEKTYFLWILLLDTHHPYLAPRKYRKWSNLFDTYFYNWKILKVNWEAEFNEHECKKLINAYDDSILYADSFIGRLWQELKENDPIFIIHADHGDGFGEHNFYGHGHPLLYEELIHIPLVIYNADIKGKIKEPVSLLDLSPTILELTGRQNEFSSESFLNNGKEWVISKIFDMNKRKLAVRMKDWKFITGQKNEDELYYLKKDPHEHENLLREHPKLVKEMQKIVKNHIKEEKKSIHMKISNLKRKL